MNHLTEGFETTFVSITDAVAGHAKWQPNRTALVCGARRATWAELNRNVNRVAHGLAARGVGRGAKVSVLSTNSVETVEVILGVVKTGAAVVPLSPMLTADALEMMISDPDSTALFVAAELLPGIAGAVGELTNVAAENRFVIGAAENFVSFDRWKDGQSETEPAIQLAPEDDFNIIYSSGTTGAPKGIVHTHYARSQFALITALEFRLDPRAVALVTTPLYSNGTWLMLLPALVTGSTLVIMPEFTPQKFLAAVQEERCTHTFMVPTQYIGVVGAQDLASYDTSSLRVTVSSGAPLRPDTKRQVRERLCGGLFELYGLTEGIATTLKPEQMDGKTASVGTPIYGGDIRIIDDAGGELTRGSTGEIVGYSAALMRGYYKQPERTAESVWRDERGRTYLRTGDVGRLDEDGFLHILDRKKDMIISGGFNVYPSDIEAVLLQHSGVAEAAVIGVPDEKWGESPLALVVTKDGDASAEGIMAWANGRLAKHQRLAGVRFRDALPRNVLGKVLKKELRDAHPNAEPERGV